MADQVTVTIHKKDLEAARRKYLQLGREIEERSSWANLTHSHSKLGIFLGDVIGYRLWTTILEEFDNERPNNV